jgi:hypothetical protein
VQIRHLLATAVALAVLSLAPIARADTITYNIPDIGTFPGIADPNIFATYTGTGFVGLYGPRAGDAFIHIFGLELPDLSRTALNVDVSGLAGSAINSAFLSFSLTDGQAGTQDVTVTSFDANGTLGHFFAPPDDLGARHFNVSGLGPNALDVTDLLSARVAGGEGWLGLHLEGATLQQFSYTALDRDNAQVRLSVDYTPASSAPEPTSLSLLTSGLVSAAGCLARRRKRTVS